MSELTVTDRDRKEAWKIVYAIEPVVGLDEQRRQATTIALALAAQRERIAALLRSVAKPRSPPRSARGRRHDPQGTT